MRALRNARVSLALHTLQAGEGTPLLLLHALGGSSDDFRAAMPSWPGPIHALDFSGHGRSGRIYGGGYYPELWAADADHALAAIGAEVVVFGCGLGAYCALLLAGGRREQARCAVLSPGAGLDAATEPDFDRPATDLPATPHAREILASPCTDSAVFLEREMDLRPPDYAARFAAAARGVVLIEDGAARPAWWRAVRDAANAVRCDRHDDWTALALEQAQAGR
jgi:pimeloyl-ACP methyl ester carboxylesterase